MGSKTNYAENKVLDHMLGTTNYAHVSQMYLALFTTAPTDSSAGTEVSTSGTAYARQAIDFAAASGGSAANSGTITFPEATASWGTVTGYAICDAATSGNQVYWGSATSTSVALGDQPVFDAGEVVITED